MTKKIYISEVEITRRVSENLNYSQTIVDTVTQGLKIEIKNIIKTGEIATLKDFGKFYLHNQQPKRVRNPHTKEMMQIGEVKILKFSQSDNARKELNE